MKICITGGAGYVGSVLVGYLLRYHHRVTVFDNLLYEKTSLLPYVNDSNFTFIKGDVRNDSELLKEAAKHDVIISLAALVGAGLCDKNPVDAELVNFRANRVLCENKAKGQIIFYQNSNSGYGTTDGSRALTEEDPLTPISIYGKTKCAAEDVVRQVENHIVFRLATVFGVSTRPRTDLLVNNLVLKALKDKVLVLYESENMRNYIHVLDVCRGIGHALFKKDCLNNVFNFGNDAINMTKMQLCEKIKEYINVEILRADYLSDPDKRNYIISSEKFYKTGFKCDKSLDDGIKELIEMYKMIDSPVYANY